MSKSLLIPLISIIFLAFSFTKCYGQKELLKDSIFLFTSLPSFHKGFSIELNIENSELIFREICSIIVADTVGQNGRYFREMDSTRVIQIQKLLPRGTIICKKISNEECLYYLRLLSSINNCRMESDIGYLDGIQFVMQKGSMPECDVLFFEKNITLLDCLNFFEKKFNDNELSLSIIEDAKRYLIKTNLKVVSEKPLYLRLLDFPNTCQDFEKEVLELPEASDVYIDLTNYEGNDVPCISKILRKKYAHLRWITPELGRINAKIFGSEDSSD